MVRRRAIEVLLATVGDTDTQKVLLESDKIIIFVSIAVLVVLVVILGVLIVSRKNKEKKKQVTKTEQILDVNVQEEISADYYSTQFVIGKLHNVGKRTSQQDSFAVSDEKDEKLCKEKGIIAIVADGMGGLSDGDKISSMVTLSLLKHFYEKPLADFPGDTLLDMLKNANREVNSFLKNKTARCGSTLVTGIIKDKKLYWLSVGDSHIYLYRGGYLMQLNREHTYREELDLKVVNGEISMEEAIKNPQRTALTSYIGMGQLEKIDKNSASVELKKGDRLIFATDGVFGTMKENQIASVMQYPVEESIRRMNDWIQAVGKNNQDNYTAVVIECR